jgi:uncharacterized protein
MLGTHGLTWPWESLHVEALAWFDHWLKGRNTGILDGPKVRYWLPGAEQWRMSEAWPPAPAIHHELALRGDGTLDANEGDVGERHYMTLGGGTNRAQPSLTDPPSSLIWTSLPLERDLDVVGDIELRLDALSTASDTAWIVALEDIDAAGDATLITAGYLRASLREIDEENSRRGAPVIPCRNSQAVPIGELVRYRLPLVPNARRFAAGHRLQLHLSSDDQDPAIPASLGFRHASVGTSSLNTVRSSSRLVIPVLQ